MRGGKLGLSKSLGLIAAAITASIASPASAAYTISFQQVGFNVVSTGSGSLNLAALALNGSNPTGGNSFIWPSLAYALVGSGPYDAYQFIVSPGSLGSGAQKFADTFSGGLVGAGLDLLFVPFGYTSGTDLGTGTATYLNADFSSLGLTPGNHVFAFGQGSSADSLTVQIGEAGAVPEPATWAMMLLGFGGIGFAMRRRRRVMVLQQVA